MISEQNQFVVSICFAAELCLLSHIYFSAHHFSHRHLWKTAHTFYTVVNNSLSPDTTLGFSSEIRHLCFYLHVYYIYYEKFSCCIL